MKIELGNYDLIIKKRMPPKPKPVEAEKAALPSLQFLHLDHFERDAADIRVMLYHGDGALGSEHIYRQWRHVFVNSAVPFIGLIRNRKIYDKAATEFPDDPLVLLVGNAETPALMSRMPNLRAVMHTGNPGNMVHLLQYAHLRHCFIGHGDSDKNSSASKTFRVHDEIWVAGQGHIDRLKPFGSAWEFRIVGRPQAKEFMASSPPAIPSACYLPTWEGPNVRNQNCSLGIAEGIATELQQVFPDKVSVKLHPSTGFRLNNLPDVRQRIIATGADLIDTSAPIDAVMRISLVCVTDISSVVSDWLTSQRPAFVYVPSETDRASLSIGAYCYLFSDTNELRSLLDRVVVNDDDWLAGPRSAASEYLVSSKATKTDVFTKELRDVAGL